MTTRRSAMAAIATLATLAGAACSVSPHVRTDFDKQAGLSAYKTFAIEDGRLFSRSVNPAKSREEVSGQFRDAVTRHLTSRGLTPSSNHPDLLVTYVAGALNPDQIESLGPAGTRFRPEGRWSSAWNGWWILSHKDYTLLVDVMDANTKQLVYRAYCEADVEGPGSKALIEESVAKALDAFPADSVANSTQTPPAKATRS